MATTESLLLAAFPPELAGLECAPPDGWHVAVTGVGGINAAVATAKLLQELSPQRVLFIGTCGAYTDRFGIGDCLAVSETIATSVPELQGRAFRPQFETTRWLSDWTLPLPLAKAAVTLAITSNAEDAKFLAQIADVEHLELAGVFAACHTAKVPVAAALAVTNRVGPSAHAEWRENHEGASRRLVETIMALGAFIVK
jgi:purine-nucleoside phosphorylase